MTWHDYLPEALSPKPVTLRMRVLAYEFGGAHSCSVHSKELETELHMQFIGKYPVREGEGKNGKQDWAEETREL